MDILIKQVLLNNNKNLQDIGIDKGKISIVSPKIEIEAKTTIEGEGRVVIPGLIDSHIHLDKAYISDRVENKSGTLAEAIKVTAQIMPTLTKEDICNRAEKTLLNIIKFGTTSIRTHVEFDPTQGFAGLETILGIKEKYENLIDIQVVAFPQVGIFKCPGTEKMLYESMEMGADVVGGIPYNDMNPKEHIDLVFKIAKKYDKPIDFHQDFMDDADNITIEYLCDKTIAEGYEGRVSVGHLTALAALPDEKLKPLIDKLRLASISVMSLPATDLHLGGRVDSFNVRRTLTPIRKLRDGGVNVCIASNNIQNAFTPYGNGDLLMIANLAIAAGHLGGASDLPSVLPMLTVNPAKAMGIKNYGIKEGNRADLVLLDTFEENKCIIDIPNRLYVIKDGKITVKTEVKTQINL